ncbi:MAG: KamA family radical SAM protein [bacterium]
MTWRDELRQNLCTVDQLADCVELTPKEQRQLQKVVERHPMSVTRYYLSLINKDDPDDPIRRLIIPSEEELDLSGSYDTSGEIENTKAPGLQHKYRQTALILATNRCAAYCRPCFRKRLVGLPTTEVIQRFEVAARYIREHPEITNVLISGGDPLVLPTRVIRKFLDELSTIAHLDFIRIGTRLPVVFPKRILEDGELLYLLQTYSRDIKRIYVVTQFNHEKELTRTAVRSIKKLIRAGMVVSNQTVLLKGINDSAESLALLMRKLVRSGITPYYVFQCRPVKRVKKRFQVPLYKGLKVVEEAKKMLDGHSKRFRYVMSHRTGKVEILGIMHEEMYFKYHQAREPRNMGRFFTRRLSKTAGWLDDLEHRHMEIPLGSLHSI